MAHNHEHQAAYNRAFALGILLNVIFVAIELVYGFSAHSMALIADAGHNLSDVLSLLLAWGATLLATRPATEKKTYGFRKATILASLASAILLLVALGGITREAIGRFASPQPVDSITIIIVAAVGLVINTLTALLFYSGQKEDLNIKGAFLHMAADAAVSAGVVVAGTVIYYTGWLLIDPLISILIVVVVLIGTWSLLRDSFNLAIDAVPENIDMPGLRRYLVAHDQVCHVHDLHVWPLSTTETALSVHLVVAGEQLDNNFLHIIHKRLHDDFGIEHATIQVEKVDDVLCPQNGCQK